MDSLEWENFLSKKRISPDEWKMARTHSQNWFSCAVGTLILNQPTDFKELNPECSKMLNSIVKPHLSKRAEKLGMDFHNAIIDGNQREAKKIFKEIRTTLKPRKLV